MKDPIASDCEDISLNNDTEAVISSDVILNTSAFDDLVTVLFENRYVVPFIFFLSILVGYQLSVAPYHVQYSKSNVVTMADLKLMRPVLSNEELARVQITTLHAETLFKLPLPSHDTVALRFHSSVGKHGNHHLPDLFYEGVIFGVTGENSHDFEYTAQSAPNSGRLLSDLQQLSTKPTHIMNRDARHNQTGWHESGYAVYYSYADLERQGRLSSDKLQPWKRVCEDVLGLARKYHQVYITAWYPSEFAHHASEQSRAQDPHRFTTLVQQTLPTRTGLNALKSTAAVWLSLVNSTAPTLPLRMYQKEWTEDDHWSMHAAEGSN